MSSYGIGGIFAPLYMQRIKSRTLVSLHEMVNQTKFELDASRTGTYSKEVWRSGVILLSTWRIVGWSCV